MTKLELEKELEYVKTSYKELKAKVKAIDFEIFRIIYNKQNIRAIDELINRLEKEKK